MFNNDSYKIEVGEYISYHRNLCGLSQSDLAFLVGISTRSMSNIENGYFYPSLPVAYKLNNLLNISLLDFISLINEQPLYLFNDLYKKYLFYIETKNFKKLPNLYKRIDNLKDYVSKDTIYYKQLLFIISLNHLINKDYDKSLINLKKAYDLKLPKSKISTDLNYRILLLKETISPDLGKNSDDIDRISTNSIYNLQKIIPELEDKPELKMKFLYNILVIKIENMNDFDIKNILAELLELSQRFKRLDIYYQVIFYRGLYKFHKSYCNFFEDINDALEHFFITENIILFNHNVNFLKIMNIIE